VMLFIALAACQGSRQTAGLLAVSGHTIPPESIRACLVVNTGISAFGGEVFCACEPLDAQQGQGGRLYLWALCRRYLLQHGTIVSGSDIRAYNARAERLEPQNPGQAVAY
jgi:hypothetical protein